MTKVILVAAIIAVVCLVDVVKTQKGRGRGRAPQPEPQKRRTDKNCKEEGVASDYYFTANNMCDESNSDITMDPGRSAAKWEDVGVSCSCHEAGWLRCKETGKRQRSRTPTTASSVDEAWEEIYYQRNSTCYDLNSENRSDGCNKKAVVLVDDQCRCHEQGWYRCIYRYSPTKTTTIWTTTTAAP